MRRWRPLRRAIGRCRRRTVTTATGPVRSAGGGLEGSAQLSLSPPPPPAGLAQPRSKGADRAYLPPDAAAPHAGSVRGAWGATARFGIIGLAPARAARGTGGQKTRPRGPRSPAVRCEALAALQRQPAGSGRCRAFLLLRMQESGGIERSRFRFFLPGPSLRRGSPVCFLQGPFLQEFFGTRAKSGPK